MAKNKKTSDNRRKKLQELVEERKQDANSFFSGNENVTRENIGQKRKEDSNNFKKESAKRKTISSSSNQSNNYTYSSRDNDYELPTINNNENRFQLPTINRPQMPTMNFQSRARRNSSFTGINLNENSLKDKQKETSRKVFEALNPGKKLSYTNKNESKFDNNFLTKQAIPLVSDVGTTVASILKSNNINNDLNNNKFVSGLDKTIKTGFLSGIGNFESGMVNAGVLPIGEVQKALGKITGIKSLEDRGNISESIGKAINNASQYGSRTNSMIDNGFVKTAGQVSEGIGNMAVPIAVNIATGGEGGNLLQAISAGGNKAISTLNEENSNPIRSALSGGAMGGIEYYTNKLFGGNILAKGSLDDIAGNAIKKIPNKVGQFLANKGYAVGGEIIEENLSNIGEYIVDKIINNKDMPSLKQWFEDSKETTKTTFLTTIVLDMLGFGGADLTQNTEQDTEINKRINEAEQVVKQNIEQDIQRIDQQDIQQSQAKQDITERINNSNLSEEDKSNMLNYVQNEDFTQADYNAMRDKIENSEQPIDTISQEQISSLVGRIDKSNLPNEDKLMMKDYIQNNNVSQADIDSMNKVIDSAVSIPANNELVTNQNFKDNVEARKKYTKYKNDTGEYNSNAINEVLDLIPENRNGNRTVKQWLQVAKETGTRIADLSNEEIERIAYKSWFDVQPSKNITKYDRQSKSTVGFQKLTSDEWINEINKAVNEVRNKQMYNNQDILKESKARDKNGNLLNLYHGTDAKFDNFENIKTEPGYWFTEDKEYALSHGKNLKTVNLDLKNPIDLNTADGEEKLWKYAREFYNKSNVTEKEILSNKFKDYLQDKGYDGMIWDHDGKNTYIAFNSNQIIPVANNQETLYNNNEREVSSYEYGEEQRRDNRELQELFRNERRQTDEQGTNSEVLADKERRKREQKQKIIEYANKYPSKNLTQDERSLISNIEKNTGIKTILYDLGEDTPYGGLSKDGILYIDKSIEEANSKDLILHELIHGLRQINSPIYINEIFPIIKEISNNKDYSSSLIKYISEKSEKFTIQDLEIPEIRQIISEEIVGNTSASLYGEQVADYDLSDDMIISIKNAVGKIINSENSNQSSFIMPTAENTEINPYRNTGRANKLIKEKNNKIEQLENNLKQALTQEEQNNIQQEIQNTEKLYTDKIQSLYDEINNKDNNKEKAPTRHEVIQKNREIARQNIENIANWNDKKSGIRYQLETMERNMYDIIPDKAEAKRMNDTYFEPIHTAEADKQKFINKYNDRIKKLELNKYEAEAVQVLGEQKYNPSFDTKEAEKALDNVKKNIEKGRIDQEKVDNAIEEFRSIYDELFDLENKVLRDNGYKEKDYRKGYFPHFIDYTPETTSEKILNKLGFKIDKRPLPTDIAGITEQFVPGKTWNRSALQRKTNKTDYNALKGFDTYIAQASDNIFHTENIQRLRGLENEIRYQYSDKGVQKRIDEILNNDVLDADEKQDMIDAILKQVENPMPNLVTELRRYTNALANKKSEADRSMEQMAGRQVYSTINAIENKFGANAVGLNIGSAVTNFIPITQAWSQIGTKNIARASIDYSKSLIEDDGFVNKSAFLTSRLNQAEKLYQTWSDKATSKANFLFDAIDDVASNIVVRGKYLENIQKGMSETEAIKNADQFARNVIADRSKGALPTKFEEKNPISKAFTQFQLEVNNQYRYMFKDIPRDLKEKGLGTIAIAYLKMFVGAWLYNKFAEKITGRKPAFSPIDLIKSSYDTIKDEKMGTYEKITKIGKDIGEQAPFIGGFLGGGRIPINGALPNIANVTKAGIGLTTGEMDSKKAKETLGKEFSKPLYYLLPPLGGGQLKKSVEGISAVNNGGSYGIDKDGKETLQFPVESKNVLNYIKAGVFGKYALPEAKTYTDSGFKGLNAKQTEAYKEIKMPYKEFIDYTNNKLEKTSDKINYINNMKISDDQKWGLYKYDVLSSTQRDDGTSQKSDAEYAINNKLTTKKEYMDLYNKANNNNISMPNTEELKNIKEQGISLKTFVDYKINSKGNKKQSDKIKMLLDSNYSDEEKGSLYINYINKNDNQYETMKATGIDIDEYIKYKQQNFKSDTTDNGTLKGKSERNKKNKVVKYLNSMNIKGNQRLLLYAMERYKTTPSQKNQLVKYVNSLDLKNKEKLELLNKFSGFTVYKNGQIKY